MHSVRHVLCICQGTVHSHLQRLPSLSCGRSNDRSVSDHPDLRTCDSFSPHQSLRTFPSDRCSGGRFSDSPTQTPRLHFPSQQLNVSMIRTRRRRDLDGIIAISISWEWGMTWTVRLRHATPRAFETSVHRNVSRTLRCHVPKRRSLPIALSHEVCCPQK